MEILVSMRSIVVPFIRTPVIFSDWRYMSSLKCIVAFSTRSVDIIVSFGSRTCSPFSLESVIVPKWSLLLYSHNCWKVGVVLYVFFRSLICLIDFYRSHIFFPGSLLIHFMILKRV